MTRILQERKKALGLSLHVAVLDATKELPRNQLFGGVLIDAPCSGIGTWSRNPHHRWRMKETDLADRSEDQGKLLDHACQAVQPGGVLVYSVCTLTTCETEQISKQFLENHPDFSPEAVHHPLHPDQKTSELWVLPGDGPCNGMYIAVFRKEA